MMTTAFLWKFLELVFMLGNLAFVLWLGIPRIRAWLAHRRHLKNQRLLRNNPHELKKIIKDKDRIIAWYEDAKLSMMAEMDRMEIELQDKTEEIRRLTKRNIQAFNELRCDDGSDTQVLRPMRSARWG